MQVRTPHYFMLVALGIIWGSSFPFIKVALESFTPISAASIRLTIAAIGMTTLIYSIGLRIQTSWKVWRSYAVIAVIGNVVPFALISWGQLYIDAALASMLMGLTPLSTILIAHAITTDEKLSTPKFLGVMVGGGGVVILIGHEALQNLGTFIWAQLAVVTASFCYGFSSVFARRSRVTEHTPLASSAGILICSSVISLPIAFVMESPMSLEITMRSLSALVFLSLVCTCAAYFLLYSLLAQAGATFTSFNNYLVPVFGMLGSVVVLGEVIATETYTALALIVTGLVISQWKCGALRMPFRAK